MHNRGGAIDLVRVVRPMAALREMYEINGREDGQCDSRPQAEHEQRVGSTVEATAANRCARP
jgi:hypothetical protein